MLKRRLRNLNKKEKFKPEIKPMTENLQDEFYQLENKQAESAKLRAIIRWELKGQKCSKNLLQSTWKIEYAKSNNIWIIYTDDINQNILAVLRAFSNLQKNIYEKLCTKITTFKAETFLLDFYYSWGKFGTMRVTSRTGIVSAVYKKGDKRDAENYRPILFSNLDYRVHTTALKN